MLRTGIIGRHKIILRKQCGFWAMLFLHLIMAIVIYDSGRFIYKKMTFYEKASSVLFFSGTIIGV